MKALDILKPLVEVELAQSSFYVQLANICNKLGYFKAESYFLNESKEEREHFLIHYDYITGRGWDFQTPAIEEFDESGKSLYEVTERAKEMETKVSAMYQDACAKMFPVCQMTYNHLLQFLKIQQEALKFYIDACTALRGLDKTGEMVVEKKIYAL